MGNTTLNTLHPVIAEALKGHAKHDPFTLNWLRGRCLKIDQAFPVMEIQMAELRQHIAVSPTSKTTEGGNMYVKGPKFNQ